MTTAAPPRPVLTHTLGFPRMGAARELKFALERHWRGETDAAALQAVGAELRARHWQAQRDAGLGLVTVGDFAYYDHVANHIQLLGCEPARFGFAPGASELARYFALARGTTGHDPQVCGAGCAPGHAAPEGHAALEMTKWFDTNYHYLVPELHAHTQFHLGSQRLFDEVAEAQALGRLRPLTALGKRAAMGSAGVRDWLAKRAPARTMAP